MSPLLSPGDGMLSPLFSAGAVVVGTRLNLLFLFRRSFEEGGGFAAIVGAKSLGSLLFSDTLRVTTLLSCILASKILAMSSGMYS